MSCLTPASGLASTKPAMIFSKTFWSSARQCAKEMVSVALPVAVGATAPLLEPVEPGPAQALAASEAPAAPSRPRNRRRLMEFEREFDMSHLLVRATSGGHHSTTGIPIRSA